MDRMRKIVLSVVFSLGIISCRTTVISGDGAVGNIHNQKDIDWTVSANGVTVYYTGSQLNRNMGYWWGTEDSLNILDDNAATYIKGNFISNPNNSETIKFKVVANESFVATMRVKISMNLIGSSSYNSHSLRIKVKYKNQSVETDIYYSGVTSSSINYDNTIEIYDDIDYLLAELYMKGFYTEPYIYLFSVKPMTKSHLHGNDGIQNIQFLDDDINGSELKYKDKNGSIHNLWLCDIAHSHASRFRIKTSNGVKALGKV